MNLKLVVWLVRSRYFFTAMVTGVVSRRCLTSLFESGNSTQENNYGALPMRCDIVVLQREKEILTNSG